MSRILKLFKLFGTCGLCQMWDTLISNFFPAKVWDAEATSYGGPQLHGKVFLLTTKSIINFITEKSISPRQNQFHHGKIIFIHSKMDFTTAKSFWISRSRDISSQSAMGVNPIWQSSSWFDDSTCIAQTVEIVCLQQQISGCSVDKVSRNWLMM